MSRKRESEAVAKQMKALLLRFPSPKIVKFHGMELTLGVPKARELMKIKARVLYEVAVASDSEPNPMPKDKELDMLQWLALLENTLVLKACVEVKDKNAFKGISEDDLISLVLAEGENGEAINTARKMTLLEEAEAIQDPFVSQKEEG